MPPPSKGVEIFHAGTKAEGGRILANGGRVLNISALGKNVGEARERAYEPSRVFAGRRDSVATISAGARCNGKTPKEIVPGQVASSRDKLYTPALILYIGEIMGVIIKNPATEAKIRKLAERTGESLTDAVDQAVGERLSDWGQQGGRGA